MPAAKAPPPAAKPRPQYPIESVDNALRLLLMFRDRGEIRLSEAREALGEDHDLVGSHALLDARGSLLLRQIH